MRTFKTELKQMQLIHALSHTLTFHVGPNIYEFNLNKIFSLLVTLDLMFQSRSAVLNIATAGCVYR